MRPRFIVGLLVVCFFLSLSITYPTTTQEQIATTERFQLADSEELFVDAFDDSNTAWTESGADPWLGDNTDYISTSSDALTEGWFEFPSTSLSGTFTANISIYAKNDDGAGNDHFDVIVDFVGGSGSVVGTPNLDTSYAWFTYTITGCDTEAEVNAIRVQFESDMVTQPDDVYIERCKIGLYAEAVSNNAPQNDMTPTLDNADDSTFMFAQYREYEITVYVSDADGFADIDYLEVSLWDNGQSTEYFRFRYDEDTDTFTEEYDSGTVVSLNTGSSSAVESGNDIDATFIFTIDWDHADLADIDLECYVVDDEPESDTDFYEANFDVETRLDYSVAPSITGDDAGTATRGDLDEAFTFEGTLKYYQASTAYPASDQIDVWLLCTEYGSQVGPWSDLTLTSGAFSITGYSDNAVGLDTYTVKPVLEGAGSGGSSEYYTTDLTDDYIADRIQVQTTTTDNPRLDISTSAEIRVTLYLEYDSTYLGSGDTVILDSASMSWDGVNSWFDLSRSESVVGEYLYFVNSTTETEHGITGLDLNSKEVSVIFDSLTCYIFSPEDQRININANASGMVINATYDYDGATYDGSLTINDADFAKSTVGNYSYYVASADGDDTHGITAISSYNQTWCVFDRLVLDIQADLETPENNQQVNFTVSITFDFDDSSCTTYNIKVSRNATHWYSFTYLNVSLFVDSQENKTYDYTSTLIVNEPAYNITAFTANTERVIWSDEGAPTTTTTTTATTTITAITTGVFYHFFLSLEIYGYFGPVIVVVLGYLAVVKDKDLAIFFYILESFMMAGYFLLGPAYWWHSLFLFLGGFTTWLISLR